MLGLVGICTMDLFSFGKMGVFFVGCSSYSFTIRVFWEGGWWFQMIFNVYLTQSVG